MRKSFTLMFPVLLLTVLSVGLVFPASATKGSYPGINGKIAFSHNDLDPQQVDWEIFVMDNDGTNVEQLTHNDVSDSNPCWSPDGTKIAFYHGGEIWIMDADGSNQRQLTTGSNDHNPAWSPDGKKIAFDRQGDIYVIDADGPTGLGTLLIQVGVYPSWSPDGTKILYSTSLVGWLLMADATTGSDMTPWTDIEGRSPCWSPDGMKITYNGPEGICVLNADGSNKKQLTTDPPNGADNEPNWSPDGKKIVFDRSIMSIMVMDADGTNEYDLTPSLSHAIDPDYQRLEIQPVGGVPSPINKFEILTPYIALAGLIAVASTIFVIKRRKA